MGRGIVSNTKILSKARRKIGKTTQRVSGKLLIFKIGELYISKVRQQSIRSHDLEDLHTMCCPRDMAAGQPRIE